MNQVITEAREAREELRNKFAKIGVDGVYREIIDSSHKKVSKLIGEGNVLLQRGRYHSAAEIKGKKELLNDFYREYD
jgi:hypothetical protein